VVEIFWSWLFPTRQETVFEVCHDPRAVVVTAGDPVPQTTPPRIERFHGALPSSWESVSPFAVVEAAPIDQTVLAGHHVLVSVSS